MKSRPICEEMLAIDDSHISRMRREYAQSPHVRLLKFAHSLPNENKRARNVGIVVKMMVKFLSNVVGLFKLLVWPSGGTPLGRVQRSTPGNRDAKPELIAISFIRKERITETFNTNLALPAGRLESIE